MEINGIVLINKDRGISSNSVVGKVKRILNADKAGHYGTLDVLGEGLLPVALGKGTKLFDYFLNKDKVYKTVYKFGETTATLDLEGEVTERNDVIVTRDALEAATQKFIGKMSQMPPIYSAKKINGKCAYQLAREGKEVILKPKDIDIYSIKVLKQLDINLFELEIWCSSGTFIRSLCRDIASELGTYGVMSSIQRTKCGIFNIDDAVTIEQLEKGNVRIIPLDEVFDYGCVKFNLTETDKLLNGMTIDVNDKSIIYNDNDLNQFTKVRCYNIDNSFLGIGEIKNKKLKLSLRLC